MNAVARSFPFLGSLLTGSLIFAAAFSEAAPRAETFWPVDDVRVGMKGQGRTVMKGTKIETFDAEVLGVLKNVSPGRDLVLCRLSGLDLEKTGVIAGMSGSPVYIQGKLLGAVAYAWAFGKEPIAGITPFCQMARYVASYERRDLAGKQHTPPSKTQGVPPKEQRKNIGLSAPLSFNGKTYDAITVSDTFYESQPTSANGLWLTPLRTPLAATGLTPHSLSLLEGQMKHFGMVPMQGGAVSSKIVEQERETPLLPGSALTVALIQGDFDLSGIGTVTHVDGKRVFGWGHPFFGVGSCEFPLMTGYVHAIYPRVSLSFKMGSPIRTVGVINADVSTCIAGWLDREPDMLPVRMTVRRSPEQYKTFNVKVVRQRTMIGPLVFTCLTNSVDMEGELPEELTAHLKAQIDIEGRPPVIINDIFSGSTFSGGRAPQALFTQISAVINQLTFNNFQELRINNIECTSEIQPGRRTADIEAVELDSDTYAPGETLKAVVFVRPYKGLRQPVPVTLDLPADLPEGSYTATVSDDLANARQELRDNPNLGSPQCLDHVFDALNVLTSVKRTSVVLRLPMPGTGVALEGKTLPRLPPSMVHILGSSRRTGTQTLNSALVARASTDWVVQGVDTIRFTVAKKKRFVNQ
jgi:hypothetical protein